MADFQDRRRDVSFRAIAWPGEALPSKSDPILIIGGGLGGLTTALALAQRGIASRVLEGAPEFGAIGYGIQFGPNVFHVLDRIGITAAVMEKADCPPAVLMRDAFTGDELVRIPTGASFRARFKHPYIIVHRIDLHNALLDACRRVPEIELVPDAMVTGFEERDDGVAVATADGRSFTGPALVAADGIRSLVRAKLIGDGEPRPIGYVAHRTIVPMSELKADVHRHEVVLWGGPGLPHRALSAAPRHAVQHRRRVPHLDPWRARRRRAPIARSCSTPTATPIRRCASCWR